MQTPDQVGPYRILRCLGVGGMGEVYLAEDTRLDRRVALKTIAGEIDAEGRDRLLREARAAARLNHPGIAAVYDVIETAGGVHIVMEYVPGETLAQRLERGPLPVGEVLSVGGQLATALAEAHRLGVIHRDLKPGNVAIMADGRVKVLDFGLAKRQLLAPGSAASASSSLSSDDLHVVGTPAYIPPEHFLGEPIGPRGDIYSFGVTLFELLTGRRPFQGRDFVSMMAAVLSAPTPTVRDLRPTVPASLDALVRRAMAREPKERHASAEELSQAIDAVAAEVSGARTRVRSAWTARWSGRRRPLGWWGAAVAAALAVTAAIGAYARVPGAGPLDEDSPVIAVMPLSRGGADPQEEALGAGVADVLTTSLSKVGGVTVIPRSSLLGSPTISDPAVLGRSLGATAVVNGSVQKVQDRIRVVVQLTRPQSKALFWSETFDGSAHEIFALQGRVATGVARALRLRLTAYDRAELQSRPTSDGEAFAQYSLGRSLLERADVPGNIDRSIAAFERAIGRDTRFARAYAGAASGYWLRFSSTRDRQSAERAHALTLEALRLDPKDVEVRCALAHIYRSTGRRPEAIEELRKAISDQPASDLPHGLLGKLYADGGDLEAAAAELRRASELRPNYWGHFQDLGLIYYRGGRYVEAAAALQRVTELQPDNSWGYQMLGTVQHASGDLNGAASNYRRALELAPNHRAYTNLGTLYYEQGRPLEALAAFEQAAKLDPKSPTKHRNLGDVYRKLERPEEARRAYWTARSLLQDVLRTNVDDAASMASLAVVEAKLGDIQAARDHAAAAVAMTPRGSEVLYKKAVVEALTGHQQEGLAALRSALEVGYSVSFARKDEDLSSLRSLPGYAALVDTTAAHSRGGRR